MQDTAYHRAHAGEVRRRAETSVAAKRRADSARERRCNKVAGQSEIRSGGADEGELSEGLSAYIARRPRGTKYRTRNVSGAAHAFRSENDSRRHAPRRRAEEELRIRQVEARQILWVVYLDTLIPGSLEKQLDVIVQANVETQR